MSLAFTRSTTGLPTALSHLSKRCFTAYHAVPKFGKSGNYVKTHIEETIENNKWAVFSKTTCPFCSQAKQLLKDLNQPVAVVEIDRVAGGPNDTQLYQQELNALTGARTVPRIFFEGKSIGGMSQLMQLYQSAQFINHFKIVFIPLLLRVTSLLAQLAMCHAIKAAKTGDGVVTIGAGASSSPVVVGNNEVTVTLSGKVRTLIVLNTAEAQRLSKLATETRLRFACTKASGPTGKLQSWTVSEPAADGVTKNSVVDVTVDADLEETGEVPPAAAWWRSEPHGVRSKRDLPRQWSVRALMIALAVLFVWGVASAVWLLCQWSKACSAPRKAKKTIRHHTRPHRIPTAESPATPETTDTDAAAAAASHAGAQ
ncbi:Glutaredoxin-1 [Perkinsus chesapeaki]|uniref:Glutaredoxin-1 n=1 Tax=Perkinsus chesapeaki TaxID=330153 RepID=A0A7J6LB43_PERCH|nr:Glutaredoxin-1 [Perkinsus chesapeaki]